MSRLFKTTALLALASAVSAALCPSFTLTADSPGNEWDGQKIIQSGRSTYMTSVAPTAPDAVAVFFRNDTTHLYATNFTWEYMGESQTPPFLVLTLGDGFPLFLNNTNDIFGDWTSEAFNVTDDGYVGFLPTGAGIAGNDSSIGGWWVCYDVSPGTLPQVSQVQLGTAQNTADMIQEGCVQTLFKITDVNVTAADYC